MKKIICLFCLILICSSTAQAKECDKEFHGRTGGEFYLFVGDYLGDETRNSIMFGTQYSAQFTETWGAGLNFSYTRLTPESGSNLAKDIRSKDVYILTPVAIINNPMLMKAGKARILCDLFATLGAGPIKVNSYWEPNGMVGGGLRIYINKYLAVRFDVNTYIHPIRRSGKEVINADMSAGGGFTILWPNFKLVEEEQHEAFQENKEIKEDQK